MPAPSQSLPTVGQPNSTEDPKSRAALLELQQLLTQTLTGLDGDNLSAVTAQRLGLSDSLAVRRGKLITSGAEAMGAVAIGGAFPVAANFSSLPTPDKVASVAVSAGGQLVVDYSARVVLTEVSGSSGLILASFGLFLNGTLVKFDQGFQVVDCYDWVIGSGSTAPGRNLPVEAGMIAAFKGYTDIVGPIAAMPAGSVGVVRALPPLVVSNLAAGTYDVEIKWVRNSTNCSAATVQDRVLRVKSEGF